MCISLPPCICLPPLCVSPHIVPCLCVLFICYSLCVLFICHCLCVSFVPPVHAFCLFCLAPYVLVAFVHISIISVVTDNFSHSLFLHCSCFQFVYFVIFREKDIQNYCFFIPFFFLQISGIKRVFVLLVNPILVQSYILCICLPVTFFQMIFVSSLGHLCFRAMSVNSNETFENPIFQKCLNYKLLSDPIL